MDSDQVLTCSHATGGKSSGQPWEAEIERPARLTSTKEESMTQLLALPLKESADSEGGEEFEVEVDCRHWPTFGRDPRPFVDAAHWHRDEDEGPNG